MDGTFASEGLSLSANAGHLVVDHELRDQSTRTTSKT
jgi:hypothetical protein